MNDVSWAVSGTLIFALVLVCVALLFAVQGIKVVPQQTAWVVERLGKFHAVLNPGLNIIIPFIDRVAYRHSLKEIPLDTPSQVCITRDNTQLTVDGVLYFQVTDPKRASYGTSNYVIAITQLAQTTLRSVIGRMELDKTFEERDAINNNVVSAIDEASPGHAAADHGRARKARPDRRFGREEAGADQSCDGRARSRDRAVRR